MDKKEIESILIANWYLTKCKIENPLSLKTELAKKYLNEKIKNLLSVSRPISLVTQD
jgi:hypothetical protein